MKPRPALTLSPEECDTRRLAYVRARELWNEGLETLKRQRRTFLL